MATRNTPKTFGELYIQIQEESVLTPEQENALRDQAMKKYGIAGLLSKQKESISVNTRDELSALLNGVPERDQILAKLDPLLPGKEVATPAESITQKKPLEVALKTKTEIEHDEVPNVKNMAPVIATTVAGVGSSVVGAGLMSEKGWKTTLESGFKKFKEWIGGLFNQESMFGGLLGGFKETIMGLFDKLGDKLGIQAKKSPEKKGDEPEQVKEQIAAVAGNGIVAQILVKLSPAKDKYTAPEHKKGFEGAPSIISHTAFLEKTPSEIFALAKKYPTPEKSNGLEKEFGTSDIEKHGSRAIWYAISSIASEENFLSKYTKDSDWKAKKLSELFPGFSSEFEILSGFENIKSREDLMKYFETDIFGGDKGAFGQSIATKIDRLKATYTGLDAVLVTDLFVNKPLTTEKAKIGKNDPEQLKFLDKLETYRKAFSANFLANKSLNLDVSGYKNFFTGENELRPHEALKLFIVTGGKTNFAEFSTPEKLLYYKTLISLLGDSRRDTNSASYGVATQIVGYITSGDTTIIPEDVKSLLGNVLGGAVKSLFSEAVDFTSGVFKELSPAKKAAVVTAAAALVWIIPQLRVAKVAMMALMVGLGIGGVTLAQASKMSDSDIKKQIEEYMAKNRNK